AQRSAEAAKETARLIEAASSHSSRGVEANVRVTARIEEITKKSEGVSQSLERIVGRVREVDELVSGIALASKEQTSGLQQITTAVGQMDKVTQGNAAGAEETAAAAQQLSAQALELENAVARLTQLVNGAGTAGAGIAHHAPAPTSTIRHPRPAVARVESRGIPMPEPASRPAPGPEKKVTLKLGSFKGE
ncbi:MAG TPA: methyl-accepting chemotaxis protein, partial [Candidatus Methylacidiphilales bacterium]